MNEVLTVIGYIIFWLNQFWDFMDGWNIFGSYSMLDLVFSVAVATFILRVTLWYVDFDDEEGN